MKKNTCTLIALSLLTLACNTSNNSKVEEKKLEVKDSLVKSTTPVLDKDFEKYLSKFYYSINIPVNTDSLIIDINNKIPPLIRTNSTNLTDYRLKPLTLEEVEKYIGIKEMEDAKKRKEDESLEFYCSYKVNTKMQNVVTCLIFRSTIKEHNDFGGFLLINYDINGNIIEKKMIDARGDDLSKKENYEQKAVILEDVLTTKRVTYSKDSTFITNEKYSFEGNGELKLINKQVKKKKWEEGD